MSKSLNFTVDQLKIKGFKYSVGVYVFKTLLAASDYANQTKQVIKTLTFTNAIRGL